MRFQSINNFSQQYRTDSTWLNLTSSVSAANMNAIKLQTGNQPFYFNYRTRNRGKDWLSYVLSTNTTDFAGWKEYAIAGLEIRMFNSGGTRIFDDYIIMFRSKVAGEWLSWISNASLDIMEDVQNEQNLGGTLDAASTFSGWESKGDIQAIDIRIFENVGESTGELPPVAPSTDFDIPNIPNNPNGFRIYIDAGHGGSDPGACNGSCYEKDYTLQLSLLQKQYFEQAGYRVTLSRDVDRFVDNNYKASQANLHNADLYIANHINSFSTGSPNGVEVYRQVNPSYADKSREVAQKAIANIGTMFYNRGVKTKTQDDGRDWFCVLIETEMPTVLVEHCFISNSSDLAKLNDASHVDTMVKAVVKAVCDTMLNPPVIDPPLGTDYMYPTESRTVTQHYSTQHTALDIAGSLGVPIYAIADGIVSYVQKGTLNWVPGTQDETADSIYSSDGMATMGNMVAINYNNPDISTNLGEYVRTVYMHLRDLPVVTAGASVSKGQVVGYMGSTGRSTGVHLHFTLAVGYVGLRIH